MPTYCVTGKERAVVDHTAIADASSSYQRCVLDVGAGDGKGSLRYARNHSDVFVIAVDSSFDALTESSKAATKKPSRGGVGNFMCLYGNIRDSYRDLIKIADNVRVILPWGDLLEGIADVDPAIVNALAQCGKKDSEISFVINAEIWKSNLPARLSHLGEVTPEFFTSHHKDFLDSGINIRESHAMSREEIEELDTTWTAKLMSTRDMAEFIMATGVLSHTDS